MDDPQTPDLYEKYDVYDDEISERDSLRKSNRERSRRHRRKTERTNGSSQHTRKQTRVESRDGTFRCKHCKTIVGVPISGGKHRNHCPLCLYSRHVDRSVPGDRGSECRSMMLATGLFTRRDGEQVLMHVCLGCGTSRHNRVAADDNVVAIMRLPVVNPTADAGATTADAEESA